MLDNIQIQPYYRKLGFAKKLIDIVIDYTKEAGLSTIKLHAYPLDKSLTLEQLIKFYEKYGFKIISQNDQTAYMQLQL